MANMMKIWHKYGGLHKKSSVIALFFRDLTHLIKFLVVVAMVPHEVRMFSQFPDHND